MPIEDWRHHDRVMRTPPRWLGFSLIGGLAAASTFIVFLAVSYFVLSPFFRMIG